MSAVKKLNVQAIKKKESLITQLFLKKVEMQKEIARQKKELRILMEGEKVS